MLYAMKYRECQAPLIEKMERGEEWREKSPLKPPKAL
jgi:hypothetical protein